MQLFTLGHFMVFDGILFVLVGIIVLINPSPQPTLKTPVNEVALPPFEDTRRLLASQFITSGLLIFTLGWFVHDVGILRLTAFLRVLTLLIVLAVNISQLRRGFWKPQSLYVLIGVWMVFCALYLFFGFRG